MVLEKSPHPARPWGSWFPLGLEGVMAWAISQGFVMALELH